MTPVVAALLLTTVTAGWFMLSLLPALRELAERTDVAPLKLTRGAGDIRHFATSFRAFVDAELAHLEGAAPVASRETPRDGVPMTLRDESPAWYVPAGLKGLTLAWLPERADDLADRVVVSRRSLEVRAETSLLKELFVDGALQGGADVVYRAALVTGNATLGPRSSMLRWIDSGGELRVGANSVLYGRASAWGCLTLERGVRFQRIAAPCIRFEGTREPERGVLGLEAGAALHEVVAEERPWRETSRDTISLVMLIPPEGAQVSFGRWLINGDFNVPDGATVDSDLIVSGVLTIGDGAVVRGAVKSATLVGGARVVYHGAIVATTRLEMGAGSVAVGPIVVEGEASLGADCRVGGAADETTISAMSVRAAGGVAVYGEVWVRGWGEVV